MASPTQWTWVWVNSGSWWWTGKPDVLLFMGSQRVGRDWATELNWRPGLPSPVCIWWSWGSETLDYSVMYIIIIKARGLSSILKFSFSRSVCSSSFSGISVPENNWLGEENGWRPNKTPMPECIKVISLPTIPGLFSLPPISSPTPTLYPALMYILCQWKGKRLSISTISQEIEKWEVL